MLGGRFLTNGLRRHDGADSRPAAPAAKDRRADAGTRPGVHDPQPRGAQGYVQTLSRRPAVAVERATPFGANF